jgi:tetratricopeptide (TPR) repeat protein
MQLRPWQLWTPDGQPAPEIEEIRGILENALARAPDHAGLCHFYIHAMEAGPEVARAVPAAERLETLAPGIGHLVHMPSHVYIWTGRYQDAVRVNQQAVAMDLAFARAERQDGFYLLYLLHNYHFIAYGGMWTGQRALALEAARDLVGKVTPEALAGMLDFLDVFTATPLHVLLRFGRWNEILAEPEPDAQLLAHRAVRHYARGVALAALGRVDEALAEQERFRKARAAVPESRMLFNNKVADILAVADAVLAGEIDYRRGDLDAAFAQLRSAVELDARLNYDEPWGWMEPARHALGALLVEQGRHAEAERVYREDLARFPENGWSLHGLAECLRATGRAAEADDVERRLRRAWQWADTALVGSCFCRTK